MRGVLICTTNQRNGLRFLLSDVNGFNSVPRNIVGWRLMRMQLEEAIREIQTKPVVPLWPVVGLVLDMNRGSVYRAVNAGEIEVVRYGSRIRAITAPLRKKLGIDAA
jgi:hypothetical protein